MDKPSRVHLRLLALALPLTACFTSVPGRWDPKGTDQVTGTIAAAQFLVTSSTSASSQAFTYLYFLTEYTVPVVIGFALWRSRAVPRWLAARIWRAAAPAREPRQPTEPANSPVQLGRAA